LGFIKKLAGQTAVYGVGTIIPRFLNYALLTPFYVRVLGLEEYGVVTELYAYMAILLVLLTYGMETAYFRFATKEENQNEVYYSALVALFTTSLIFIVSMIFLARPVANIMQYEKHPEYIILFSLIVGIDALLAIPFARLRMENKVYRFSFIKIVNVMTIVMVAVAFLWMIPKILESNPDAAIGEIYSSNIGVGYVFIANLCGSLVTLALLLPTMLRHSFRWNRALLKRMLIYAFPLLIAGLAGVLNDSFDKAALKYLWPDKELALEQLAIYGANFKIAVIMGLFIQMFRYAAEPFFFANANEKNAKQIYAQVMTYFVLFSFLLFLGIALNVDIFKHLLTNKYWGALNVVPIVLFSYIFYGIFVNLSIWYKLNDLTKYAALLTIVGAIITLLINLIFVPKYGYYAAAWAHSAAYLSMVTLSYFLGRKYYPVPYNIKKMTLYFLLTMALFIIAREVQIKNVNQQLLFNNTLLISFVLFIYFKEIRKKLI